MAVNMRPATVPVKRDWQRSGNSYVGSAPEGILSFGDAAFGGRIEGDEIIFETNGSVNFTAKANAAPMYYWDASEGSLNSSPLSRRAFTMKGVMHGASDLEGSSDSVRCDVPQHPSASNYTSTIPFFMDFDGGGDHIAIFAKRKTNFTGLDAYAEQIRLGGTPWNIKGYRYWSDVGDNNVVLAYGQNNEIAGNPRINTERVSSGSTYFYGGDVRDPDRFGFGAGWHTELYRIKQSTINVLNGLAKLMIDGQTIEYALMTSDTSWPNPLRELYGYQAQYLSNELNFAFFYDVWYADDTPHMIVFTDQPTWQDSPTGDQQVEIAIPLIWTPTLVRAKLRPGAFGSVSGKFGYILDDSGEPIRTNGLLMP